MIYITGDKHGDYQLGDLKPSAWPAGQTLSKDDYLIITGDFGGVFDTNNDLFDVVKAYGGHG